MTAGYEKQQKPRGDPATQALVEFVDACLK